MENSEIEKFQQYIFEMDYVLEHFISESQKRGYVFDYSISSLNVLETYLIDEAVDNCSTYFSRASRYLGEVFRKNIGGSWDLCSEPPNNIHFGLPVLVNFTDLDFDFCPSAIISNFLKRRTSGLLAKAVESNREFRRNA